MCFLPNANLGLQPKIQCQKLIFCPVRHWILGECDNKKKFFYNFQTYQSGTTDL